MPHWPGLLGISRAVLITSARATLAAVASMLLSQSLKLPEFYWAPISAIVVILSTVNPRTIAWQRFVGTALGAALGALITTYFHPTWIVYGAGIFVCGILSALLRIGTAYRFAAITFSIVLLIAHTRPPWIIAVHRFVEVSVGIAVALIVAVAWPAPADSPAD
ncbi:MAG: FUSC family protein [Candidatus Sulfotelmatobacter sp.]